MARLGSWIESHPEGIYVRLADAWIDPSEAKPRALITHGHSDHARGGHGAVLATQGTLAIMECRYGLQSGGQAVAYGENSASAMLTSASCRQGMCSDRRRSCSIMRAKRSLCPAIGKRRSDPTCSSFVPVPCDVFITEATFGLPVFRHPETGSEIDRLLHRLHSDPSRCKKVGAYALGKAQRIICELRQRGHSRAIYVHGAIERLNQLYQSFGVDLGELRHTGAATKQEMAGHVVIAPPERSMTAGRGGRPIR